MNLSLALLVVAVTVVTHVTLVIVTAIFRRLRNRNRDSHDDKNEELINKRFNDHVAQDFQHRVDELHRMKFSPTLTRVEENNVAKKRH